VSEPTQQHSFSHFRVA